MNDKLIHKFKYYFSNNFKITKIWFSFKFKFIEIFGTNEIYLKEIPILSSSSLASKMFWFCEFFIGAKSRSSPLQSFQNLYKLFLLPKREGSRTLWDDSWADIFSKIIVIISNNNRNQCFDNCWTIIFSTAGKLTINLWTKVKKTH